jgi:hypothetical protein
VLPPARKGKRLTIRGSKVEFSFWPVAKTTRRYGLTSRVYVNDPWPIIAEAIAVRCLKKKRDAAQAFRSQAEEYYRAAYTAQQTATKPLLFYYAFLNLVKAYLLTTTSHPTLSHQTKHGLRERANLRQIVGATVTAEPSEKNRLSIFSLFLEALGAKPLTRERRFRLGSLLPQLVPGHRIWCEAAKSTERFVRVNLAFYKSLKSKSIWLTMRFEEDDCKRLGVSHVEMLRRAGLNRLWQSVESTLRSQVKIEQSSPAAYKHRPSDHLTSLVRPLRLKIWSTVLSVSPYRSYYVYLCPSGERRSVLPQLASMYAVMFFLGSVTRYRPEQFENILDSPYGAQIENMLHEIPGQFLFLMASEFLNREVAKASII